MDKETLSHYGWIVILVMILAVLLALATPFGTFVADGFKATYAGFDMVGNGAMDVVMNSTGGCTHSNTEIKNVTDDYTGDTVCDKCGTVLEEGKYVIPEGGIYYVGVTGGKVGDYSGYTAKYGPGEEFPETVNFRDVYVYQDYEYRYNQWYMDLFSSSGWIKKEDQQGWGVHTLKQNKTSYMPILKEINGKAITNASCTFYGCTNMTVSPEIPETVISMYETFMKCSNLKESPIVPAGVTNMESTFNGCTNLLTTPVIPNCVTTMRSTFKDCAMITKAPDIPSTVTNVTYTFSGCTRLQNTPVIPEGITDMTSTFAGCASLTNEDIPNIPDTVKVMEATFSGCSSLTDISSINIPISVTDMDSIFQGCTSLKVVPDLSYLTNVRYMQSGFANCSSLQYAPKLPGKVSFLDSCFKNCTSLVDDGMPQIPMYTHHISYMFAGCTSLVDLSNYSVYGNSSYTLTANSIFEGCTNLVKAPRFAGFGLSSVTNALKGCSSLTGTITLDIDRLSLFTYDGFFNGIDFEKQNISLVGTSKWIDDLGETGINYCRECNGRHKNANEAHTCHGGNATCQQKAICMICNKTYGDFAPCNTSNGKCTLCNKTVTTIQSKHDPYDASQNYVVLGTWDYSDAKSVNITVIHQMENADYDWFSITSGKDYISGQSQNQTRTYLSKDGNLIQNVGSYYAVKFCDYYQSGVVTKTFENIDMLTGSVIFKTSDNASSFYGATVIITPNY